MNKFKINYDENMPVELIPKLERELREIGPGPIKQQDGYFTARLKWGATSKDLGNLKGRLDAATAQGFVTSIEVI